MQKKNRCSFLALEYSGHGKSSGEFIKGNITKWSNETSALIKKIVKKNDFIIVGSSMGTWIALKQFQIFKKQIKGFLGIGSAPEFLENLMWKKFTKKIKKELIKNKIYNLKKATKKLTIVKNGDHSLSSKKWLNIILKELRLII